MAQFIIETRFIPGDTVVTPDGRVGEIIEFIYRRRSGRHLTVADREYSSASDWNSYLVRLDDGSMQVFAEEDLDEPSGA
jgi:hypothetical protein